MRPIIHNNNNDTTGGTIEYSGTALTMTTGDWFIVLPATNFRRIGDIYNNSAGGIDNFIPAGDFIQWNITPYPNTALTAGSAEIIEDITIASPLATEARVLLKADSEIAWIGHPGLVPTPDYLTCTSNSPLGLFTTVDTSIAFCKYYIKANAIRRIGYRMPS
jgi:hypothetical protein